MLNCSLPLVVIVDGDKLTELDQFWQWIVLALPSIIAGFAIAYFFIFRPPPIRLGSASSYRLQRLSVGVLGALLSVGAGVLGAGAAGLSVCGELILTETAYQGAFVGSLAGGGLLALLHIVFGFGYSARYALLLSAVDVALAGGVTTVDALVRPHCLECAAPLPATQLCLAGAALAAALVWSPLAMIIPGSTTATTPVAHRTPVPVPLFDVVGQGRDRSRVAHYSP